ncbi:MFS transporter [Dyella sp. GSA-30]|uniref:MFS transporter n=1 Tax=Dyella sp. GSA-30 TaxID=2994496 RepID=UPI00248F7D20|nr:MFS transporter [Dyella sp. GSA-30]BDU19048.1 MFS transporter [Dyella sp. GSA-30]
MDIDVAQVSPTGSQDRRSPSKNGVSRDESVLSPRYRAATIGMVALVALGAFESLAVATAMPTVAAALDGVSLYTLSFAGALAANIVGMVAAGRWSDVRGPIPPLWIGVALFMAGLLVSGWAQDMTWFLWGRIVQGVGSGAISVVLYVIAARTYPERLQPKIFGAFSAGWVIPSLIGPTLTGVIVEHVGWRWVFLAVPLLALPAALMMRPGMRSLASVGRKPLTGVPRLFDARVAWACGAAIGVCLLHLASEPSGHGHALLTVVALIMLFVSAQRLLPKGSLRARPGVAGVIALRAIAGAVFFGTEAFIPLLLSREYGLSPVWAGAVLMIGALGWSLGSWYQGNTQQTQARNGLLRKGMSLMIAGVLILSTAIAVIHAYPMEQASLVAIGGALVAWALTGAGMGLVYPSLSVLLLAYSAPDEVGNNSSALRLADALGVAGVLALDGAIFARLLSHAPSMAYLAVFSLSAVLAVLGLALTRRTVATEVAPTN